MPRGRSRNTAPANPAPDHNLPGSLATRSDGANDPASPRDFHAEQHGDGVTRDALASAAPGSPSSPGAGAGGGGQGGPSPAPQLTDVFAPNETPPDNPLATLPEPSSPFPDDDPYVRLRALYNRYPHPDILNLLQKTRGGGDN